MPTTRKKVIKTVYKDENDSEPEESGDFSDSGSDAKISGLSSSEDDEQGVSSGEDFEEADQKTSKAKKPAQKRKVQFAKNFIRKIRHDSQDDLDENPSSQAFSVKDLTDADKLLPSFLNLSESDSSEDESPSKLTKVPANNTFSSANDADSDNETKVDYQDVWSNNIPDNSEEIAQKTFKELEIHKTKVEETKASILNYTAKASKEAFDVKDLLAQGEDVLPEPEVSGKKIKKKKKQNDSDSEMEDWEEVKESKALPASGLQVIVDFPDAVQRKSKKVDVEMMMKRKMNRVKKEYQVYMHKVHVLCWLGHGNYVSSVLNDQEIMSAVLTLVPSKECYPGERVDVKYVEQITKWFNNKITLKQDKHENKFKPKAAPLKEILLKAINTKVATTKKYMFFIFVSMLRALGLQCRVMFNFVTLPIRPPSSELCSLSTKIKEEQKSVEPKKEDAKKSTQIKQTICKNKSKLSIPQVDGNDDSMQVDDYSDSDIMQVDGNDDANDATKKVQKTRASKVTKANAKCNDGNEDVSPPKRAKKSTSTDSIKPDQLKKETENKTAPKRTRKTSEKTLKPNDTKVKIAPSNRLSPVRKSPVRKPDQFKKETENKTSPKRIRKTSEKDLKPEATKPKRAPSPRGSPARKSPLMKPNQLKKETENKTAPKRTRKTSENDSKAEDTKGKKAPSPRVSPARKSPLMKPNQLKKETENKTSPKRTRKTSENNSKAEDTKVKSEPSNRASPAPKSLSLNRRGKAAEIKPETKKDKTPEKSPLKSRATRNRTKNNISKTSQENTSQVTSKQIKTPKIIVTNEKDQAVRSNFFEDGKAEPAKTTSRRRSKTADPKNAQNAKGSGNKEGPKPRSKSVNDAEKSKYFNDSEKTPAKRGKRPMKDPDDELRVSHRDIATKTKTSPKNDVASTLIEIMKTNMEKSMKKTRKLKAQGDSDYQPDGSDEDFKPSPKPSTSRKVDRRVLSTDDEIKDAREKTDVWCEVFVEELEQWIAVDVVKGQVHCTNEIYNRATHPVCYILGWDNNNYLKDLTRRYVPHWNTVTRKQRAEVVWLERAIAPWKGPRSGRDKEEDEALDRLQLDAPLPKIIGEYKNHPLYALKRHLLKYEALYPPDAATLGFVRNEAVYARECVYICQSRDKWLKEAKVVKLGEKPYKVVKARPKWDRLSNKLITDKPLEIFGPWQVQDYVPPVAENGIVPRNAYGNVELFKDCMLPKGTVHIKLPGLNKVAKKLNIDCAPAMTGFDFNGGWSHPVYDGFVVCKEFEEVITQAWLEDQEEMERREREKTDARVYGNWKRLIKGLMIRERLKLKYGFEEPSTSAKASKPKGPRFVAKKKT